jgi:vancomycin resistance protein YoaR
MTHEERFQNALDTLSDLMAKAKVRSDDMNKHSKMLTELAERTSKRIDMPIAWIRTEDALTSLTVRVDQLTVRVDRLSETVERHIEGGNGRA